MADAIKTCVVGFGLSGRIFHAAVIHAVAGLELSAIVQRHGDEAATAYPGITIYRDVQSAIDDPSIQLLIIATDNESHYELAKCALEAGKHVVVEKPVTLRSAEAVELGNLSRTRKRIFAPYHNRRWDGDFLTVQGLLQGGSLGKLLSFESHFDRWRPKINAARWRENGGPGGGILWDLGPHLVDQALALLGNPEAVYADVRTERQGALVDDAFDLRLYYPGVSVVLRSTCMACVPGARFTLLGTRGCFVKYGLDPQEAALVKGERFDSPSWGTEDAKHWGMLTIDDAGCFVSRPLATKAGDYRGYYANVRDAILGVAPLAVTARQGAKVIRILELARESSRARAAIACNLDSLGD